MVYDVTSISRISFGFRISFLGYGLVWFSRSWLNLICEYADMRIWMENNEAEWITSYDRLETIWVEQQKQKQRYMVDRPCINRP